MSSRAAQTIQLHGVMRTRSMLDNAPSAQYKNEDDPEVTLCELVVRLQTSSPLPKAA